jgi:hypothetical protein
MDSDKKRASWLDKRDTPRGGDELVKSFRARFVG